MPQYDSHCTSGTNWVDLTRTCCLVFEPEPFNLFDSFDTILKASFKEEPVGAHFVE